MQTVLNGRLRAGRWATAGLVMFAALGVMGQTATRPGAEDQAQQSSIEARLRKELEAQAFPSLSFAVVQGDKVVMAGAMGVADREKQIAATADTVYGIGSISKVFTATLMLMLRDEGKLRLDDGIALYLPGEVKLPGDGRGAREITLRHLATHTSGLPRLPVNLARKGNDPYGGYSVEMLYAGLGKTRLEAPIGQRCNYSNLGVGLLGHVLERAAGEAYEDLLSKRIFSPLGMESSGVALKGDPAARMAIGYREADTSAPATDWDLGCLGPAGAIKSSARDMAKFLMLQFQAGKADVTPIAGGSLTELHTPQRLTGGWDGAVGLGWHIAKSQATGDIVWHNGGLEGFRSYMGFCPSKNVGIVIMTNCGKSVDELGRWMLAEAVKTYVEGATAKAVDAGLEAVARSLTAAFVESPAEKLNGLFADQFLAAIPIERVSPIFAGNFKQKGACEGVDITPKETNPRRATLSFKFKEDKRVRCEIEVDSGEPAKIVYLLFPP